MHSQYPAQAMTITAFMILARTSHWESMTTLAINSENSGVQHLEAISYTIGCQASSIHLIHLFISYATVQNAHGNWDSCTLH